MKQYKEVMVKEYEEDEVMGRVFEQIELKNVICMTIEEAREMYKQARRKTERGDAPYIYPELEDYLTSKGINTQPNK